MLEVYRKIIGIVVVACSAAACTAQKDRGIGFSTTYDMSTSNEQPVSEIRDFQSAQAFALQNGYYDGKLCQTFLHGGENVWFSASYDQGEAGQAYGTVQAAGNRLYFNQQGSTGGNAMFAPGLADDSGQSLWEFHDYFRTLCSVGFGLGENGPDYDSVSAKLVDMTGGTAGGSVSYKQGLELTLSKNNPAGCSSSTILVFVKSLGPRVMEFREDCQPAGTAKVYIDSGNGASGGSGDNTSARSLSNL